MVYKPSNPSQNGKLIDYISSVNTILESKETNIKTLNEDLSQLSDEITLASQNYAELEENNK